LARFEPGVRFQLRATIFSLRDSACERWHNWEESSYRSVRNHTSPPSAGYQ
jgi:hypothetical protein